MRKYKTADPELRIVRDLNGHHAEYQFLPDLSPEHCVAYAFADNNQLMSKFFECARSGDYSKFDITHGKHSVCCGNFACAI